MSDQGGRSELEALIIEQIGPHSRLLEPASLLAEVTKLQDMLIQAHDKLFEANGHRLLLMQTIIDAGLALPKAPACPPPKNVPSAQKSKPYGVRWRS